MQKVCQPKKFPQCSSFNHLEIFVLPGNIWGKFSPPALICWQFVPVCPDWPKIACIGCCRRATAIIWTLAHYGVTTVWLRVDNDHTTLWASGAASSIVSLFVSKRFQNVHINFNENKRDEIKKKKGANVPVKVWHRDFDLQIHVDRKRESKVPWVSDVCFLFDVPTLFWLIVLSPCRWAPGRNSSRKLNSHPKSTAFGQSASWHAFPAPTTRPRQRVQRDLREPASPLSTGFTVSLKNIYLF